MRSKLSIVYCLLFFFPNLPQAPPALRDKLRGCEITLVYPKPLPPCGINGRAFDYFCLLFFFSSPRKPFFKSPLGEPTVSDRREIIRGSHSLIRLSIVSNADRFGIHSSSIPPQAPKGDVKLLSSCNSSLYSFSHRLEDHSLSPFRG